MALSGAVLCRFGIALFLVQKAVFVGSRQNGRYLIAYFPVRIFV